ncbi:MAG: hypothetical protein KIS66_01715 [Fimbriimonadaceae bacterium]|nr:hypothetical protein [Fimbriimonadaceae bacterium]
MNRTYQIALASGLTGVMAAGLWFAFRPSPPLLATPEAAQKAGFSSAESYSRSLALIDEMHKHGRLSPSSLEAYRHMAENEGENGELLSLTIMLDCKDREQRKALLAIATKALLNSDYQPLPARVFANYRIDTPDLVDGFIARHPEGRQRAEGK